MNIFLFLSHKIEQKMPLYGTEGLTLKVDDCKSIKKGDSCNIFKFEINSHLGTHIDAPAHFFNNGTKVVDYKPDKWIFNTPFVLEVNLDENQVLGVNDFKDIPEAADIVLIKSGFQKFRGQAAYNCSNPGLSPEVPLWLRVYRPNLKVVGIDFISVSPYQNRKLGRETHRAFLDPDGENEPILILEDMNLSEVDNGLSAVWVMPLITDFCDSAPCTVIGKINRKGR